MHAHRDTSYGEVAERLNALVLKTSKGASPSWVRIPPSPPLSFDSKRLFINFSFHPQFSPQTIRRIIDFSCIVFNERGLMYILSLRCYAVIAQLDRAPFS